MAPAKSDSLVVVVSPFFALSYFRIVVFSCVAHQQTHHFLGTMCLCREAAQFLEQGVTDRDLRFAISSDRIGHTGYFRSCSIKCVGNTDILSISSVVMPEMYKWSTVSVERRDPPVFIFTDGFCDLEKLRNAGGRAVVVDRIVGVFEVFGTHIHPEVARTLGSEIGRLKSWW